MHGHERDAFLIDARMMDCKKAQDCFYLFADDEMEEELLVTFRAHLGCCPECERKIVYTRKLLELVRKSCTSQPAPEWLRVRIRARLSGRYSED